jgi:hypothetical protein
VRPFTNPDDALAWLEQPSPPAANSTPPDP